MNPIQAKEERAAEILTRLKTAWPDARPALKYSNALELLVATILSAQCTDERVNQVTASLFQKYRTAHDYASADLSVLEEEIRPTGFYRNKAKALKGLGQALVTHFGGEVPDSMEQLVTLPGVGRKTANVVLGNVFHKNEGIVVDTHMKRLANRLELSLEKNPDKIEEDLMKLIPQHEWTFFGNAGILHGRHVCQARKPKCSECVLSDLCPSRME